MTQSNGFEVVVDAIRREGRKWYDLSDDMSPVAAMTASLHLGTTSFLVCDQLIGNLSATDLKTAYDSMHELLSRLLREATIELEQVGDAILRSADRYEAGDQDVVGRLEQIWSEPPAARRGFGER